VEGTAVIPTNEGEGPGIPRPEMPDGAYAAAIRHRELFQELGDSVLVL
jgi:hypothetical protein